MVFLPASKSRALKGQSIAREGRLERRRQCQNRTLPPLHGEGAPLLGTGRRPRRAAAFPGVTEEAPSSDINSRAEQSVVTALNVWGAYKSQSLARGERPLELGVPADTERKRQRETGVEVHSDHSASSCPCSIHQPHDPGRRLLHREEDVDTDWRVGDATQAFTFTAAITRTTQSKRKTERIGTGEGKSREAEERGKMQVWKGSDCRRVCDEKWKGEGGGSGGKKAVERRGSETKGNSTHASGKCGVTWPGAGSVR